MDIPNDGRSLHAALFDTAQLVESLGIKRKAIVDVSVCSYRATVHLNDVDEFVRVFKICSVQKKHRDLSFSQAGNLHAAFYWRKTRFCIVIQAGSDAFEKLMQCQSAIATQDGQLIEGKIEPAVKRLAGPTPQPPTKSNAVPMLF